MSDLNPPDPARGRPRRRVGRRLPAVVRAIDVEATIDLKRAVPAVVIALIAFGIGEHLGGVGRATPARFGFFGRVVHLSTGTVDVVVLGLAFVFLVSGLVATRSVGREIARVVGLRGGIEAGNAVRLVCLIVGYLITLLGLLALLRVDLGNLLVGGAVTGVVIGIAAQQTLGNFFAGLVLLFARPYVPGQRVKIRTGSLGGPFVGVITGSGLMYTSIETEEGEVKLPNAGLLASAVGPAPDEDDDATGADSVAPATGVEPGQGSPPAAP